MTNLFITIVPTKVLANGQYKIRIAMSHSWDTRYIPTNIVIDSLNELKNGKIVKRSDKKLPNARLKRTYDTYYERCESIEYANSLTCKKGNRK